MAQNEICRTVKEFLREHPNSTLDLMTPMGCIYLLPEQGEAVLRGEQVNAHPGVPDCEQLINANEILCQTFCTLTQDKDDPNLFYALTDYPEEVQEDSVMLNFGSM